MKPFEDPSRRARVFIAALYIGPLIGTVALAFDVVPALMVAMEEPPARHTSWCPTPEQRAGVPVQTDVLDDLSVREIPEPAGCRCECHREPELMEASRP